MRETRTLEFKECLTNSFLKTVSAYANYGTGKIVFGISDDGEVVGIDDLEKTCLSIENKINDSIRPAPSYTLEPNTNNKTITLTVDEGPHKPYCLKSKAYKRNDTSTVEADRLEFGRLVLAGQNLSYDKTPAHSSDLTFKTLGRQIREKLGIAEVTDDVLKTLELESPRGEFNVAAELLADGNAFPGIDVARFGDSISVFKERATFEGESVLLQYDHALEVYRRNYQVEIVEGAFRTARDLVPEDAFREAVANSLVHRQWDVPAHIRVAMFDNRIEVTSPGGLPQGLTEEEYLEGQVSILRNPILGNVLFRLEIIERFGTGVLRIRESYRDSAVQPAFEVFENSIKITLPVIQSIAGLTEDEAAVFDILVGRTLPTSEITGLSGFSRSKVQAILKRLVVGGYITVVGSGRGTKYRA